MSKREALADAIEVLERGDADSQQRVLERLHPVSGHIEDIGPVAATTLKTADTETDQRVRDEAILFAQAVAKEDPSYLHGAVPTLAACLQAESANEQALLFTLSQVAKSHPEELRPVTRHLKTYVTDGSPRQQLSALSTLGYVSKEYPDVAESMIPHAGDLLDVNHDRVRANAAGLLADLADEYTDELLPVLDQCIDLLGDHDDHVRHNAAEVIRFVSREYPDEAMPAVAGLLKLVDDEKAATREKVYITLGQLQAEPAREPLERRRETEPVETLHDAIEWSLAQITETTS